MRSKQNGAANRFAKSASARRWGAPGLVIFLQIVVKSIVGALVGLVASSDLERLIAVVATAQNSSVIPPVAMFVAVIFGVCACVIARLFPAGKAARLDPIQLLRYDG